MAGVHYHTVGTGHLYQGRFKAFPVQQDEHLYTIRYVERNALRAGLVKKAEDWRWSSLAHRLTQAEPRARLSDWSVRFRAWVAHVNKPQTEAEVEVATIHTVGVRMVMKSGNTRRRMSWA